MGTSGALLGPNLDNYHSVFGVLSYEHPLKLYAGESLVLTTASWVPPLFGLAGVIIGGLYGIFDDILAVDSGSDAESRRRPAWPKIFVTIFAFTFQYWLSGFLFSGGMDGDTMMAIMSVFAVLGFFAFDATLGGFIVSVATAIGGPLIEYVLINYTGQYHYNAVDFLGTFPLWVVPVYFLGGPAVGNLSRGVQGYLELRGGDWGDGGDLVCETCQNSRVQPCYNCDGLGYYDSYGSQTKCKACNSSGQIICRTCFDKSGIDPYDFEGVRSFMKRRTD